MKLNNIFAIVLACALNVLPVMSKTYDAAGTHRLKVATGVRVGGIWGEKWNRDTYKVATQYEDDQFVITLYSRNDEVWNYFCKITINDFFIPSKKEIKQKQKDKKWFTYSNSDIEFFYNVEYPSIEECFANYMGFVVNSNNPAAKKRKVKGVVTFNPYFFTAGNEKKDDRKMRMVLNCHFDEVSYGIEFYDLLRFKLQ